MRVSPSIAEPHSPLMNSDSGSAAGVGAVFICVIDCDIKCLHSLSRGRYFSLYGEAEPCDDAEEEPTVVDSSVEADGSASSCFSLLTELPVVAALSAA